MSSLYLRGSTWWAKSYQAGKMIRRSLKTRDKGEARRRLRALEQEMARTSWQQLEPSAVTWNQAAQDLFQFYEAYGSRNIAEAAYRVKMLDTYFGGTKLSEIDASSILGYVANRRAQGKAAATINVELATLKKALRLAQELGKLPKLPPIRMLRPAAPRSGFFETQQFEAVARALPVDLALVVRIGFVYGWRIDSEVLTLTHRQVDLGAGTLRLEPGTTKNRDGRLIYLTAELKAGLSDQLARVRTLEQKLGRVIPWVFPTPYGPYRGQRRKDFVKAWAGACRAASCPGMLRHDLRRTAARNMVAAGVPERVVMKVMGHKTRAMLDRYHIVSDTDLRDVAKRLTSPANPRHNLGTT